jgi:epoxyqueuosine reductase
MACPQQAFEEKIYTVEEFGIAQLPGRNGTYSRLRCNRQMELDEKAFETMAGNGLETPSKRVKYCRRCELACPAGLPARHR